MIRECVLYLLRATAKSVVFLQFETPLNKKHKYLSSTHLLQRNADVCVCV